MSFLSGKVGLIKQALREKLLSRIVWIAGDRRDLLNNISEKWALVAVIGREHYVERRKRYPISNRSDIARIISIETRGCKDVFIRIGALVDSAREVQFFDLTTNKFPLSPRSFFWVPESVALASGLAADDIAAVCRGEISYYLSGKGINQFRGGAIVSPTLFRMAAGLALKGTDSEFREDDVRAALPRALWKLRLEDWLSFVGPELKSALHDLWKPTSVSIMGVVLLYLAVVSIYLSSGLALRQYQIERLGAEVAPLLEAQRKIDSLVGERKTIQRIVESKIAAWPMWEVAADIWSGGGSITNLSFKGGDVIISGTAPSAIKTLERLSARKDVAWARFDAGVRQSGEGELFVIRFRFAGGL